ncbi:DUF898 domain-containing protein [Mycoplasmatota bacterium]|nr:DUF898 domain-containing protein [Mycoplasmatota bacterium]
MDHHKNYLGKKTRIIMFIFMFLYWLYTFMLFMALNRSGGFNTIVTVTVILEVMFFIVFLKFGKNVWISYFTMSGLLIADYVFFSYVLPQYFPLDFSRIGYNLIFLMISAVVLGFMTHKRQSAKAIKTFIFFLILIFLIYMIFLSQDAFSFTNITGTIFNIIQLYLYYVIFAIYFMFVHIEKVVVELPDESQVLLNEKQIIKTNQEGVDLMQERVSTFTGNTLGYLGVNLLAFLVSTVTFGIAIPFMVCYKEKWIAQHTLIDGYQLDFDGKGSQLIGKWLLWLLLTIVTLSIFALFMPMKLKKWKITHTHFIKQS